MKLRYITLGYDLKVAGTPNCANCGFRNKYKVTHNHQFVTLANATNANLK
jgi:hypothetical protein